MKVLVLCAATTVLLAACGSDGDGDAADDDGPVQIETSPIADLLGRELDEPDDPAAVEQRQLAEESQRQDLIASCMEDKGFEYVPVDAAELVGVAVDDDVDWGTRRWAETWGYGVTTRWFPASVVGEGLIGYHDPRLDGSGSPEDPNTEIVAGLDPDRQAAYYAALYGDYSGVDEPGDDLVDDGTDAEPVDDPAGDDPAGDDLDGDGLTGSFDDSEFEPLGCEGQAYTAVTSYDAAAAFRSQFEAELAAMNDAIEADPRMVEARDRVTGCVADEGLDYRTVDEFRAAVEPTFAALQEQLYPTRDYSDEELAQMTPEELDAAFDQTGSLTPEARAQLADLQADEIELAVAVHDCGEGDTDYRTVRSEVRSEYEQAFLDEHAAAVAEYRTE